MGCCGGGGKAAASAPASGRRSAARSVTPLAEGPGGKVWVEYVGDKQGAFQVRGEATRTMYRVDGKGAVFEVWAQDASRFQREGRGLHFRVGVPPPQEEEPEPAPVQRVVRAAPPTPEMATLERIDNVARRTYGMPEEPEPQPVPEMVEGDGPTLEQMRPRVPRWDQLREALEMETWTVEGLAAVDPADLEMYPGIGPTYARAIVEEARRLWAQR